MPVDLTPLDNHSRLLFEIPLKPLQGQRFQPTGFPNLGAATFKSAKGECLLVESAQSMANRMEKTIWDEARNCILPALSELSHVIVNNRAGEFLTSSILEAHRLNSVYIEAADGGALHDKVREESQYDDKRPVNWGAFRAAVLKYDINSLLHGCFLESIGGRLRVARAVSAFIEAEGVRVVASGGVKNERVTPGKEEGKSAAEGYGNVPFSRDEFTAERILLFVNVDLAQIRGYGLGPDVERLLQLLVLFKLRALLDGDLRLRTACDFAVSTEGPVLATNPKGWILPEKAAILEQLISAIAVLRSRMEVTTLSFIGPTKKPANEEPSQSEESEDSDTSGSGDEA